MKSGKCQRGNLKWNIEEGQLIENGQKDIQRRTRKV
jgi:ribosome-associated protein YbcJ (S4-like RNA binding protein)